MMRRHNPYAPPGHKDAPLFRLSDVSVWLKPERVLLFATFLIEGLWVYLWLLLLGHGTGLGWSEVPFTIPSILLLLTASYYSVQILGQQRWSHRKARGVAAGAIAVVLLLLLRLENGGGYGFLDTGWLGFANEGLIGSWFTSMQTTLVGAIYLWWRGYHLAREGITQEQVFHSFVVGLVLIVIGLLAWEGLYRDGSLTGVSRGLAPAVVVLYFFASFLALSLSHLIRVRAEMMRSEGAGGFFSQPWTLQLIGFVTGLIVLGWIVATVFSFNIIAPLVWSVSLLSKLLSFGLFYLAYPFALLASGLIYVVRWLLAAFGAEGGPTPRVPDISGFRSVVVDTAPDQTPAWLIAAKWMLALALLALVVYLLSRLLIGRRERPRPKEALEELHESLGGRREFLRDLLLAVLRLLLWFGVQRDRLIRRTPVLRRMGGRDIPGSDMDVREIYGSLLTESGDAGFPRRREETPFEYLETLATRLPAQQEALERITQDYVRARYGERGVSPEERGVLNRMWREVYRHLRGILSPKSNE